jgi:hypothetical protein
MAAANECYCNDCAVQCAFVAVRGLAYADSLRRVLDKSVALSEEENDAIKDVQPATVGFRS